MTKTRRFFVEIRDGSNKIIKVESGYATREAAQRIADARQQEINARGWRMSVYVGEAHAIS